MRLLLDTHAFLWFILGDRRLPQTGRDAITNADEVWLSVASVWEMAIKISLGKLTLEQPFNELIPEQLASNEIGLLPIELEALNLVAGLEFHHRDPFDRLIIAQAMTKDMIAVSGDPQFGAYPVRLIWETEPVEATIAQSVARDLE